MNILLLCIFITQAAAKYVPHFHEPLTPTTEANPPTWPSTVQVFSPTDDQQSIMDAVNTAWAINGQIDPVNKPNHGEMSSHRFAFLFKPGTYYVDVPVGFYTQVLGMGDSPDDTVFSSRGGDGHLGVYAPEGSFSNFLKIDSCVRIHQ